MRALNASVDVILNALHYYLKYLLVEHAVFTLDYSVTKNIFEMLLSIDVLLMCTKLKQWELDLCISCNNFCRICFLRNML